MDTREQGRGVMDVLDSQLPAIHWLPPPDDLALPRGVVHLWKADLSRCELGLDTPLSSDESARAARYISREAREQFVAARVTLRHMLARYTGRHPEEIQFEYGPTGKPALATGPEAPAFNLSHSGARALYAVTREGSVGIDIERIRPVPEAGSIVASYFAAGERALYHAAEPTTRLRIFHALWTLKEAYIKGTGLGQTQPLDSFDVVSGEGLDDGWRVQPLPVGEEYAAALAVCGNLEPRYWLWTD